MKTQLILIIPELILVTDIEMSNSLVERIER